MPDSSTTVMSSETSRPEPGDIRLLLIEENPEEAGSIKWLVQERPIFQRVISILGKHLPITLVGGNEQ